VVPNFSELAQANHGNEGWKVRTRLWLHGILDVYAHIVLASGTPLIEPEYIRQRRAILLDFRCSVSVAAFGKASHVFLHAAVGLYWNLRIHHCFFFAPALFHFRIGWDFPVYIH
jgi:hypothetical protein